jgi:hypothetical protein
VLKRYPLPTTDQATLAVRLRNALVHARCRWLGIGLSFVGLTGFVLTCVGVFTADHAWHRLLVAFGGTGLALVTFGLHNDTALALLRDLRTVRSLPRPVADEIRREFINRRQDLEDLRPLPNSAWIATALCALVQCWVFFNLLHDFGERAT